MIEMYTKAQFMELIAKMTYEERKRTEENMWLALKKTMEEEGLTESEIKKWYKHLHYDNGFFKYNKLATLMNNQFPVDVVYEPDWQYMENYMRDIESEMKDLVESF